MFILKTNGYQGHLELYVQKSCIVALYVTKVLLTKPSFLSLQQEILDFFAVTENSPLQSSAL